MWTEQIKVGPVQNEQHRRRRRRRITAASTAVANNNGKCNCAPGKLPVHPRIDVDVPESHRDDAQAADFQPDYCGRCWWHRKLYRR